MKDNVKLGFKWVVSHIRRGRILSVEPVFNLVPTEGLNHFLGVTLKGATQQASWYLAPFEGNYSPTAGITAATFAATATECSAYDEANRVQWEGGSVSGGTVSNEDNPAEFTFNAQKNIYGAALISSATKGGVTGSMLSIVRFPTVKPMEDEDVLRITSGLVAVSA